VGDSEPSFNGDETLLCCGDLLFLSGDLDIFLDPDLLRLKDFLLGDPDLLLDLDLDFDLCLKQISLSLMSEWLLFNANSAIFQLYHGKNKLIFNEMMMRSALY
jgi:hypothetical protein